MEFLNITGSFNTHYVSNRKLGRYEYHDAGSHKYYHVVQMQGGELMAFYGRVGQAPSGKVKFASNESARERIAEKEGKGYAFVPGYVGLEMQWLEEKEKRLRESWASAPMAPSVSRPRM